VSKWCKYPHWHKQDVFLKLPNLEVLFGGAAGGGKSDSLLRAALQYAHVPGYSALIVRTDLQRLRLAGGLIPRSHEWLAPAAARGECKWNGSNFMWSFKSGATLQFGYISSEFDKYRYGSSEYQFIGFDELTEFTEEDYLFLFSRLRKKTSIDAPYRMRSATNPGGKGHDWVKSRFISKQAENDLKTGNIGDIYETECTHDGSKRVFVPSKIRDNPAVDPDDYIRNLMHLSPVIRERLMNGDWTIMPTGLIKPEWLRYYVMQDRMVNLLISRNDGDGNILHTAEVLLSFNEQEARRFVTVDTAGGVEDIEREHRGKSLSHTAIGVWDYYISGNFRALIAKHVLRLQGVGYTAIRDAIENIHYIWKPSMTHVENKAMGPAVVDDLKRKMPIQMISSGIVDKVVRAAPFTNMLEAGQVYLPKHEGTWRFDLESEWLRWMGLKDETNDQIDMASYAAIVCGGFTGGSITLPFDPLQTIRDEEDENTERQFKRSFGKEFMGGWV